MSTIKNKRKCQKCANGVLDRTHRPLLMKLLLFWLPLKKYRCNYCGKKTYILGGDELAAANS